MNTQDYLRSSVGYPSGVEGPQTSQGVNSQGGVGQTLPGGIDERQATNKAGDPTKTKMAASAAAVVVEGAGLELEVVPTAAPKTPLATVTALFDAMSTRQKALDAYVKDTSIDQRLQDLTPNLRHKHTVFKEKYEKLVGDYNAKDQQMKGLLNAAGRFPKNNVPEPITEELTKLGNQLKAIAAELKEAKADYLEAKKEADCHLTARDALQAICGKSGQPLESVHTLRDELFRSASGDVDQKVELFALLENTALGKPGSSQEKLLHDLDITKLLAVTQKYTSTTTPFRDQPDQYKTFLSQWKSACRTEDFASAIRNADPEWKAVLGAVINHLEKAQDPKVRMLSQEMREICGTMTKQGNEHVKSPSAFTVNLFSLGIMAPAAYELLQNAGITKQLQSHANMYSNGELTPDSPEAKLFDRLAQALIGVEPDKFPGH